ncbi:MAG: fatty acid desaturase [Planctomycetes bacterium]|nr:fatty acid desaturase [Planctomycetota bacterium]
MTDPAVEPQRRPSVSEWKALVENFQEPSDSRAAWQVTSTLVAYVAAWLLMILAWSAAWWLALPVAVIAAGLLVRLFIIFHDCGHGSFFRSHTANSIVGFVAGVLTWTPFHHWRGEHARHHKTSGDLNRRGVGDIWTMTVEEYLAASRWRRLLYRLSRNPLVLFGIAPLFVFVVYQRLPSRGVPDRDRRSVWWTNLALVALAAAMIWAVGPLAYLVLQGTVMAVGGSMGVWLFYVQHQFEGAYWQRGEAWDYTDAALRGSSFYRLPRVLQWFSGNIGFHHVHHLSPRIPNYRLEACHRSHPVFRAVPELTLAQGWRSARLRLWDESRGKLVGFREARRVREARRAAGRADCGAD